MFAGWLGNKLLGAAGPYILGFVAAVLLVGAGTIAVYAWQNHTLRTALAESRQATAECQAKRESLRTRLQEQNEAVEDLRQARDLAKAQADLRAVRVLERERARPLPEGHGPEAMNAWMREALR